MGSLMAGWNRPVLDAETVQLERNRSLTKEEIESFWRLHSKGCGGEETEEQGPLSPTSTLRNLQGGRDSVAVGQKKKHSLFRQSPERKSKAFPNGDEPNSPVDAGKVTTLTGDWN